MNTTKFNAAVLHSGGLDSTVCLYLAAHFFGGFDKVVSMSIDYGQRHSKEIDIANKLCDKLGVHRFIGTLGIQPESMLTNRDSEVPNISYDQIEGVSPTYVPFRNGQLLSTLAAWGAHWEAEALFFGAHAEDAKNWAYPDCTPEFIGAMANAIYIGSYMKQRLYAPLMHMTKAEIVKTGTQYGVDFSLTWSCYKGEVVHCGTCPTCRARKQAFITAGVDDPTKYAA